MSLSLDDVTAARDRIASGIYLSPCPESIPLAEITRARIYCKLEYLQRTGSFKERGARNALMLLDEPRHKRGVVAASAGNHALGLAYHGQLLGIAVTVVMPKFAPLVKITTCRRLGARVILTGETYSEAKHEAQRIAAAESLTYIHGFDDPAIVAGQGTIGLEILQQVPDVQAIVVPVGGAGLIAGIALAVKNLAPAVQVIGVESARAASYCAALAAGKPVDVPVGPTLADGLAVGRVGELPFEIARGLVDRIITVGEDDLSLAVLRLLELEKSLVEGAGAAGLAAFLSGQLDDLAGKRTVLVLSGGNIDPVVLTRVIDKGLVNDGRLCRFTATTSDRPGSLARLAHLIAAVGASIKDIAHDRAFSGGDVAAVNILCTVETSDREHIARLFKLLAEEGIAVHGESC